MWKIFYSWQSTTPRELNCNLIRDCLNAAVANLTHSAEVDEATRQVSGSPAIFETILKKIAGCAVFVADLTLVPLATKGTRYTCNPNVLIEYGYALAERGEKRIVAVLNSSFGPVEKLPFDLRHKAVKIVYALHQSATADEIEVAKRELINGLTRELRLVLEDPASELSLSGAALQVARYLIETAGDASHHRQTGQEDIAMALEMEPSVAYRAIAELAGHGYVERLPILGTTTPPVWPAPLLFWDLDRFVKGWDPRVDARAVAAALVNSSDTGHGRLQTRAFAEERGWAHRRLNPALYYLVEYGLVDSSHAIVSDLVTDQLLENERTRPFLERHSDPERS